MGVKTHIPRKLRRSSVQMLKCRRTTYFNQTYHAHTYIHPNISFPTKQTEILPRGNFFLGREGGGTVIHKKNFHSFGYLQQH